MTGATDDGEKRTLILAPSGSDARLASQSLSEAALPCQICTDLAELRREIAGGAAAVVIADEALAQCNGLDVDVIGPEPPWSLLPVVVLTARTSVTHRGRPALRRLEKRGNVTFLQRPVARLTFLSTLRAALESRQRQYAVRDLLIEREAALLKAAEREERLRESEERFREMADNLPLIVWVHDAAGHQEFVNQTFCDYFGVDRQDVIGGRWRLPMHIDDANAYLGALRACLHEHQTFHAEGRVRRGDGEWRWIESWARPRFDQHGTYVGHIGTSADVTKRKRAEEHRHLLINELNHRVKNTLSIVQAIAHQTFKGLPRPELMVSFRDRLTALATAHKLLTRTNWEAASLDTLVLETTAAASAHPERIRLAGPPLTLEPKKAVTMAMALHELCTNAVKYGALSNASGVVDIDWRNSSAAEGTFTLVWRESGGPPVQAPQRRGFGSEMIERALARELDGTVTLDFHPDGLVCTIVGLLPPSGRQVDEQQGSERTPLPARAG